MTMVRRSAPIMILSFASSNSDMVTTRLPRLAASNAASLTRFIRSAPEKPGVPRATVFNSTSGASGTLRTCTLRIRSRFAGTHAEYDRYFTFGGGTLGLTIAPLGGGKRVWPLHLWVAGGHGAGA